MSLSLFGLCVCFKHKTADGIFHIYYLSINCLCMISIPNWSYDKSNREQKLIRCISCTGLADAGYLCTTGTFYKMEEKRKEKLSLVVPVFTV